MIDTIKQIVRNNPRISSSELVKAVRKLLYNNEITVNEVAHKIAEMKPNCNIMLDGWRNVNGKDEPLWIIQE